MSKPQKYISALTSTTKQPDMAQKAQNGPNNHKIKKSKTKKSNKMKVISLYEETSKTYHKL